MEEKVLGKMENSQIANKQNSKDSRTPGQSLARSDHFKGRAVLSHCLHPRLNVASIWQGKVWFANPSWSLKSRAGKGLKKV